MTQHKYKQWVAGVSVMTAALFMTGCLEKPETKQDKAAVQQKTESVPLIQAKVVPVKLTRSEVCDAQGCTRYDLQTVETNVQWINEYFMDRLKKADPVAFESAQPQSDVNAKDIEAQGVSSSSSDVMFIGQQYHLATFALSSYSYSAGAAHGMHHVEYVNFDLKQKKRLALQDVLVKGAEQKVQAALYDANSMWLENHSIEKSKLQLSDNFYYGANGIVFVYPLYEMASYAEGMSELTLPYHMVKTLMKAEYLPDLPNYAAE